MLIAAALIGGALLVVWQEGVGRFFSARAATIEELQELIQRKEQEILILQRELQQLRNLLVEAQRQEQGREGVGPSVTAFAQFTTPLSPGDSGAEVRRLQELLYAWGYYPEGLITSYYGSLTQKAVERFQAAKEIVSSGSPWTTGYGRVGPATLRALNAELVVHGAPGGSSQTAPLSAATPPSSTGSGESGYKQFVRLQTSSLGNEDTTREYLTLEVDRDAPSDIVMTGWSIESAVTGTRIIVPLASALFRFGGASQASDPIRVPPGGRLVIVTGDAPMAQTSFRTNKCIGYLTQYYQFNPSLSTGSCPDPEDEFEARADISARDLACADYIKRLSSCRAPDAAALPSSLTLACRYFIQKELNYNACVDAHRSDVDFWGYEWRLYLRRATPLWGRNSERIIVRDATGLFVAEYSR